MSNKDLYSKINELEAIKAEIDRQQAQADALTDKIKAEAGKAQCGRAEHGPRNGDI